MDWKITDATDDQLDLRMIQVLNMDNPWAEREIADSVPPNTFNSIQQWLILLIFIRYMPDDGIN